MPNSGPVYIVDDQESVRVLLAALADEQGWSSTCFASGGAFLDAAESLDPGCVLLDMRMPGLGGLIVQKKLSELELPLAVVAITGHSDVEMAVESMKLGAVDFIEKPFDQPALLEAIRLALRKVQQQHLLS